MTLIPLLSLILTGVTVESPDGAFFAEVEYYPGTDLMAKHFTLYAKAGDWIYSISDHQAHTFYISNCGNVYAMNEHNLWFFDVYGVEQWHHSLDGVNTSGFSSGGTVFYVSDKSGIYVYDDCGNVLYKLLPGRLFKAANNGDVIAVTAIDTLYYYEHGSVKHRVHLVDPYVWGLAFSNDGAYILVEYKDRVEEIECITGAWRKQ